MIKFQIFRILCLIRKAVGCPLVVVGVILFAFERFLNSFQALKVEVDSIVGAGQVAGEDVFGLVDGYTPLETGIFVSGIGYFQLATNLPSVVEHLLDHSGYLHRDNVSRISDVNQIIIL